jgi:hypothetical protein
VVYIERVESIDVLTEQKRNGFSYFPLRMPGDRGYFIPFTNHVDVLFRAFAAERMARKLGGYWIKRMDLAELNNQLGLLIYEGPKIEQHSDQFFDFVLGINDTQYLPPGPVDLQSTLTYGKAFTPGILFEGTMGRLFTVPALTNRPDREILRRFKRLSFEELEKELVWLLSAEEIQGIKLRLDLLNNYYVTSQ